jgi:hypothetical protein
MKKTILILSLAFLSCNQKSENLEDKIVELKHRNDSLQNIIDTLNTKYIFDRAYLYPFPLLGQNHNKEEISGTITIIAENEYDRILMTHKDPNDKNNPLSVDTLDRKSSFRFKFKRSETDTTYFNMINKPKYGRKLNSTTSDPFNYYP